MKQCLKHILSKEAIAGLFLGAILSSLLGWAFGWFIPSSPVTVKNLPQKELTCILNQSYPLITKRTNDSRFQIQYNGKVVENPIFHSITISNTGDYAVSNEDFKEKFSIDFEECIGIINAQITMASNKHLYEEVMDHASVTGTVLSFSDFFINPGESFTISVFTDNEPKKIMYDFRISGISNLIFRNMAKEKNEERKMNSIIFICVIILIVCVILLYTHYSSKKTEKEIEKVLSSYYNGKKTVLESPTADPEKPIDNAGRIG